MHQTITAPITDKKGFSLMELMVVIAILSTLSSVAIFNYLPIRQKGLDSAALSDAQNLVDSIIIATLNKEDVDYTKINAGGAVGNLDTDGNPRKAVFTLSPGVEAVITGSSDQGASGDATIVVATLYHVGGTAGKEYVITVDETTGVATVP